MLFVSRIERAAVTEKKNSYQRNKKHRGRVRVTRMVKIKLFIS